MLISLKILACGRFIMLLFTIASRQNLINVLVKTVRQILSSIMAMFQIRINKSCSGLGKEQTGIKEAIKVKLKQDKHGMGHNQGDEFTFHWWDHVFNTAANSISVENSNEGIAVKKTTESGPVTNKKRKTYADKQLLYGQFIKGATLDNSIEVKSDRDISSDNNSEEEQILNKYDDETLMKVCEGMTAHKGARHGLKLNGKLVRLQEQEKILMEKYNKLPKKELSTVKKEEEINSDSKRTKKSKKKKKKSNHNIYDSDYTESKSKDFSQENVTNCDFRSIDDNQVSRKHAKKMKKLKRKHERECNEKNIALNEGDCLEDVSKSKRKKKKSKNVSEDKK